MSDAYMTIYMFWSVKERIDLGTNHIGFDINYVILFPWIEGNEIIDGKPAFIIGKLD